MKHRLALCMAGAALCAATPAFAGDGTNLIKMIPAESQIVMVFDVADARDSTLLQKGYDSLLAAKPDAKEKLAEIGLDPMKDIDTVLFAGSAKGDDFKDMASMVIIVEGRIPKDKLATIPGVKATKYAGTTIWTKEDTDVAVLGDRLFFTKTGQMKAALDLASGKAKAKSADGPKGKKLRDAIAGTDTKKDLWMTVLVPDKAKKEMLAQQGMSANMVAVGVDFTADIGAMLRIAMDTDANAQKAVSMIQAGLPQLAQMAGSIGLSKAARSVSVTADKANVDVTFTVTGDELTSIMNTIKGVTGGGTGSGPTPPPPATMSRPPGNGAPPPAPARARTP
ncbi:MAG TPA: hypothetical protein VHE35_21395 [Kofleriaceae bacterium]|nr:hypothetical protein [Kofleriaceae bacterium]